MDFAANAVFDVVAPPSRPANARPAPTREASEPTFDDHLEGATAEEEPAKPPADAKANDSAERANSDDAPIESEAAPMPTEPPAPPHIVQIVAAPTPAPTPVMNDAASVETPAPTAPIEVAPAPQAPPTPTSTPQTPPLSDDDSVDASPTESKAGATVKSAPEAAPQNDAAPEAPVGSAAPQASTPATPTPAPTPPPVSTAETPSPDIANVAVQPAPSERQTLAPQRPGKSEPQRGAKQVDAASGDKVSAQPPGAPQTQKSAPASPATKDVASSLLALQTDAPDIPAPAAQQSATPLAQPAAQSHQNAAVDHAAAARAAPASAQVARAIMRRFDGENTRFELRLDPAELGRVEVRLDVSRDNRVTAVITADSPQALTELSRHARELEQMLNSGGLELSDSGLSFDLRQGGEGAWDADEARSDRRGADGSDEAQQQQISIAARPLGFERWRGVRVDVTV